MFAVAQKLTRFASKKPSESLIQLHCLAPRSRGCVGNKRGSVFFLHRNVFECLHVYVGDILGCIVFVVVVLVIASVFFWSIFMLGASRAQSVV